MVSKSPLRFTIRDMLLVTALVAVCFGWLIDRQSLLLENKAESRRAEQWRSEVLDQGRELRRLRHQLFLPFGEPLPPPPAIN